MNIPGEPVQKIGTVSIDRIDNLISVIRSEFVDGWVKRTMKLMSDCYCIKAITPSSIDLPDPDTQKRLVDAILPYVEPFVKEGEMVAYLDISSIPAKKKLLPHIDHALFQMLSRRIHIPIITNEDVKFVAFHEKKRKQYRMEVGDVYEVNNEIPHLAMNLGETERWHIVADVIDKELYECLVKKNLQFFLAVDGSINFLLNERMVNHLSSEV